METPALSSYQHTATPKKMGLFRIRTIVTTVLAAILAFAFIWPFFCILGATFNKLDVVMSPLTPIPSKFSLRFYQLMFSEEFRFQDYILNSVVVSFSTTLLSALASALSGYALAKLRFPGRDILFSIIIGIMLLPTATMLVPRFVVMRDLGLVDNYWGLILPGVGGGAFGIL